MLNTAFAASRRRIGTATRARALLSTKVDKTKGPLGDDGRHEVWREGIYDHDNEPK
jgi:hypothetical protein